MAEKRVFGTEYPKIHREFQLQLSNDEKFTEFVIQDLTEEFFDEAVEFIVENHAKGAVFHRAAGTLTSPEGIQKVHETYRKAFEEKISLICLVKGTKTVVGLNALCVWTRDNLIIPKNHLNDNFRIINEATNYVINAVNVFDFYKVEKFIYAAGLCVDIKYRKHGIATEILKARKFLMEVIDVKLTTTVFSTVGGQKAAKSAGYEENFSIDYKKFEDIIKGSNFSHVYGNSCKIMSLKI